MVSAIVCVDKNFGIGYQNNLLANIPEDMKFFKNKTTNSVVIMGRKTYDSMFVKPLQNRINIVISSNLSNGNIMEVRDNNVIFIGMDAIESVLSSNFVMPWDIYIIGGGRVYEKLLHYCSKIYVTKVFHSYEDVDTYFPNIDNMQEWEIESASETKKHIGIEYQFLTYRKKEE